MSGCLLQSRRSCSFWGGSVLTRRPRNLAGCLRSVDSCPHTLFSCLLLSSVPPFTTQQLFFEQLMLFSGATVGSSRQEDPFSAKSDSNEREDLQGEPAKQKTVFAV